MTEIDTFQTVAGLRTLALRALRRMYRAEEGLFAFRVRRGGNGDSLEGVSRRYTAIALIGLAGEDEPGDDGCFGREEVRTICHRLLDEVHCVGNVGDVGLTLWAATALRDPAASKAGDRLRQLRPWEGSCPTVEIAWALTALALDATGRGQAAEDSVERIARRLLSSFYRQSGLFPHWPNGVRKSTLRAHVGCFADQVYPIQALAHYYRLTGDGKALDAAKRCADRICALQGPAGQWWWHYDVRSGQVVEGYPVYSVHQDAMAPMALFDLTKACGADYRAAIDLGLRWLLDSPEIDGSLVDAPAGWIWRKVARHEPGKLTRSLQALASRAHPSLRVPGVNGVLRPGSIDHECRPYHLGWLLYAWPRHRVESMQAESLEASR